MLLFPLSGFKKRETEDLPILPGRQLWIRGFRLRCQARLKFFHARRTSSQAIGIDGIFEEVAAFRGGVQCGIIFFGRFREKFVSRKRIPAAEAERETVRVFSPEIQLSVEFLLFPAVEQ